MLFLALVMKNRNRYFKISPPANDHHLAVLQGYMVVPEGDSATAIERWFFVPWLSKFAEEGGVSFTSTAGSTQPETATTTRRQRYFRRLERDECFPEFLTQLLQMFGWPVLRREREQSVDWLMLIRVSFWSSTCVTRYLLAVQTPSRALPLN